jgi:hypothetical protein
MLGGLTASLVVAESNPDWPEWTGTEPVTISGDLQAHSWQPSIAAGSPSGLIMVAWSDLQAGESQRDIYTVYSNDSGRAWSEPEVISETLKDSLLPDALVVDDRIFVAWVEGTPPTAIYEAEGSASGTWEVHTIPSTLPPNPFTRPRLAVGGGKLHMVFGAGEPSGILYTARPLTGTTWLTASVIYTHTPTTDMRYPVLDIGTDEQKMHLVWVEYTQLATQTISYMQGDVSGGDIDWSSGTQISTGIPRSVWPTIIAGSGEELHVAWGEQIGTGSVADHQYIRYAHSMDNGNSWSDPIRIDSDPVDINHTNPAHLAPGMAVLERDDQTTACVTWHGFREGAGSATAEEVLVSCSQQGEHSWPLPQNVSRSPSYTATISILPSIAFDGAGQLHVVWQELAGADLVQNYEIYYAHGLRKMFLPLTVRNG